MTRTQRQVLTDLKFGAIWLGGCFAVGFLLVAPFAFRTALRRSKETS